MANKFSELELGPSWYPNDRHLKEYHKIYLSGEDKVPLITRWLSRRQLHQLAIELTLRQRFDARVTVTTFGPVSDTYYIDKTDQGWIVTSDEFGDRKFKCKDVKCLDNFFDEFGIGILTYRPETELEENYIMIYDYRYPFYLSPDQKAVLKDLLPKEQFDYPAAKTSEKAYLRQLKGDYLNQLEEEQQQMKETLGEVLPDELIKMIEGYKYPNKDREVRRFLETRLPKGSVVGDYLGLK